LQREKCVWDRPVNLVALPRAPPHFSDNIFDLLFSPEPIFSCDTHGDGSMHGRIDILVDGSGDGHSVALFPDEEVFFSYERGASNNEAEFNAVILALENIPENSHARIKTDSQVVVWHLSGEERCRRPTFQKKRLLIQDLILEKGLRVDIQWIPRKQNHADRFLKHYIASLCGAAGNEPLHRRVRRLETENLRLRAKLKRAMKMLERRDAFSPDSAVPLEMFQ
jgi:ribonuclease HI